MSFKDYLKEMIEKDEPNIDWERTREKLEQIDEYDSVWLMKGKGDDGKYYSGSGDYTGDTLNDITDVEEISAEEYKRLR